MEHVIAVDVGGTAIKAGIVRRDGTVLGYRESGTPRSAASSAAVASRITDCMREVVSSEGVDVAAVGIGIPGVHCYEQGVLAGLVNLTVLNGYPLLQQLKSEFSLPVFIDNSANNAARGEHMFGVAAGEANFVLATLGTGVGGGIFLNGSLYGGSTHYAAEVGHMKLVPGGRRCGCGAYGCWEAYGSATALVARTKAMLERGLSSSLEAYYPDRLDSCVIAGEAEREDPVALSAFDEMCRFSGIGFANLINILNPSMCVVSGGLSQCGDFLLKRLQKEIRIHAMPRAWDRVKVVLGTLGGKAGHMGAAALAFTVGGR